MIKIFSYFSLAVLMTAATHCYAAEDAQMPASEELFNVITDIQELAQDVNTQAIKTREAVYKTRASKLLEQVLALEQRSQNQPTMMAYIYQAQLALRAIPEIGTLNAQP